MSDNYTYNDVHEQSFTEVIQSMLKNDVMNFAKEKSNLFLRRDNCPACSSKDVDYILTCLQLDYYQCKKCKTLFLNPCPPIAEIVKFLNHSEALSLWRDKMPLEMQKTRKKLYDKRVQLIKEQVGLYGYDSPSLMEIGGGRGELSKRLHDSKIFSEIYVIEPQELTLNKKGVFVHRCTFEEMAENIQVDCIVSFEVLEHLIDPIAFLSKAYKYLKPGGILIFTTPNNDSFEVELLQEKSTQIPFDHIRLYTPKALEIMLNSIGYFDIKITTPGIFDVDLLSQAMPVNNRIVSDCLHFILSDDERKNSFQKFLVEENRSSHMNCVARKKLI